MLLNLLPHNARLIAYDLGSVHPRSTTVRRDVPPPRVAPAAPACAPVASPFQRMLQHVQRRPAALDLGALHLWRTQNTLVTHTGLTPTASATAALPGPDRRSSQRTPQSSLAPPAHLTHGTSGELARRQQATHLHTRHAPVIAPPAQHRGWPAWCPSRTVPTVTARSSGPASPAHLHNGCHTTSTHP